MNVVLSNVAPLGLTAPLVAVVSFSDDKDPGPDFAAYEALSGGRLAQIASEEGFTGDSGKTLLVHTPDLGAKRVLLVGVGKRADFKALEMRRVAAVAVEEAERRHAPSCAVIIPASLDAALATQAATEGAIFGAYRYTAWLTDDKDTKRWVESTHLVLPGVSLGELEAPRARAAAAAHAVCMARDLVNAPPVEVTPRRLAEVAQQIAAAEGLDCTVFDETRIVAEGMGLLHAVGKGSAEPPRFIHLTYRPEGADASTPQVALVGKGLTYDAGGYNIKPTGSLEDMKIDMSGAAAVLGAMKAIRAYAPKVIVHGIVPSAENLVSSKAYKPGDIIRSHLGKTVEIMNTDAEGRLILADALSYAEKLGATKIVDLATLTGACVVALGPHTAGLFANSDDFRDAIQAAADRAGEDFWPMPLSKKLKSMLKSPIADMKNIGERWGGAITGALFLQEFIGKATWAHLDIAGPASTEKAEPGTPRGGTGFGILTLLELVSAEV
jgi:leucyl aminopeptidase